MKKIIYLSITMLIFACGSDIKETETKTTTENDKMVEENVKKNVIPTNKNIECFGKIDVPPSAVYEVYAKAEGFISKLTLLEGEHVKKGQVLAEIESPEFAQWQKELLSAKSTYNWQQNHFDRNKQLYENKVISDKEFQQIEKDYLLAKSTYQGWKNQLTAIGFSENELINNNNIKLQIRSKVHGTVVEINTKNGSKISANTHLFTILDKSHLHIEMKVAASEIQHVKTNQSYFLLYNQDTIKGHVYLINDLINEDNTVRVHGHFDDEKDEEKLIVGQQFFVEIVK